MNSNDNKFMIEYEELLKDINKLDKKNTSLKKKVFELQKELDEIKEIFSKVETSKISIEKVNKKLLKKCEWLISSLSNFYYGKKAFDMILANQKCVFDKNGLGYKSLKNENISKFTLSRSLQVKVPQPLTNLLVEEDILVALARLKMHPKRHQPLSQRRLGLGSQRSLTTKDPKI